MVEAPPELVSRLVRVRKIQERHTEDAVLVRKAPVFLDPAVEGAHDLDRCLDVGVQHWSLEHDTL